MITRKGITINHISYNSNEISEILRRFNKTDIKKGKKFIIKYNPLDLSFIYVFDDVLTNEYIKVPSTDKEYTEGLTEEEHKHILKMSKGINGHVDYFQLAKTKARLSELVENEAIFTKKKRAASKRKKKNSEEMNNKLKCNRSNEKLNLKVVSSKAKNGNKSKSNIENGNKKEMFDAKDFEGFEVINRWDEK